MKKAPPKNTNPHIKKIYFVGSQCVGKTSLARWVANTFHFPMIAETARTELAKLEVGFDRLRVDVELTTRYQRNVFDAQIAAEAGKQRFVSDRAFLDNLAYMALHGRGLREITQSRVFRTAATGLRRDVKAGTAVVFFVRPEAKLLRSDGFRAEGDLDIPGVYSIDGVVAFMLELWGVDYVPVQGYSMKERQRTIEAALRGRV